MDATAETLHRFSEVLGARGRELIDGAICAARELRGMELSFVSQLAPDEQIYREAVAELTREAGPQFDARVVDALLEALRGHPLAGHAAVAARETPPH